jgi:hypothetical protein
MTPKWGKIVTHRREAYAARTGYRVKPPNAGFGTQK